VLPGELQSSVEIVSVCKSEIVEIEQLKEDVYKCIKSLSDEADVVNDSKIFKRLIDSQNG